VGKIAVLGLGPSLALYDKSQFELSVGVNDIWRSAETDVVVCLNSANSFAQERLRYIQQCKPIAFWSQTVEWDYRSEFRKIDFQPGYPDRICNLDLPALPKSFCSPFVATVIAWKYYAATEIHLFGVDMLSHPHLDRALCSKISHHFVMLRDALSVKGCRIIVHGNGILTQVI